MSEVLEIIRGDYKAFNLTFTTLGAPVNITGYTLFFTAKESYDDDDDDAIIRKDVSEHTDPENGETLLELEAEDTDVTPGAYYFDFQLVNPDGKPITVMLGTLNVIADVTRRIVEEELS